VQLLIFPLFAITIPTSVGMLVVLFLEHNIQAFQLQIATPSAREDVAP
jgi:hypothetical protein